MPCAVLFYFILIFLYTRIEVSFPQCKPAHQPYICVRSSFYQDAYHTNILDFSVQTQAWMMKCDCEAPQQINGRDCGVFVMVHANYDAKGAVLDYCQDSIEFYWRRMCLLQSMRANIE